MSTRNIDLIIDELAEAAIENDLSPDEIGERVRQRAIEVDERESGEQGFYE